MKKFTKIALIVASFVLVAALSVGGTLAWLQASTKEVKNTFTPSYVKVEINETTGDEYDMIPGDVIEKNPKVTVDNDVEAYLFVKIVESANYDNYLQYSVADGWMSVTGQENVYYRIVDADAEIKEFSVLKDDQVKVLDSVTNEQMDLLEEDDDYPTLTFKAYAIQTLGFDTAELAWAEVVKLDNATT